MFSPVVFPSVPSLKVTRHEKNISTGAHWESSMQVSHVIIPKSVSTRLTVERKHGCKQFKHGKLNAVTNYKKVAKVR